MTEKFNTINFIKKLTALGERRLSSETKAYFLIKNILKRNGIKFVEQKYKAQVPKFLKYSLKADGKEIESLPNGFSTGKFINNFSLISNITDPKNKPKNFIINYNPKCKAISRGDHYELPALAIKYEDVEKIKSAIKVEGEIVVKKVIQNSVNFLIGNTKNPKNIIFSHFDSIGSGAVDNASGVSTTLRLIIENSEILNDNLFVMAGNEEIAYDKKYYWGLGYRIFEKKYFKLLQNSKQIIVLDSFGYSQPVKHTDADVVILGFPTLSLKKFIKKTTMISGNITGLMKFYHSNDDKVGLIRGNFLDKTKVVILKML